MSDNKSAEETKTENVYNNRLINNFITEINHAYYLQLQSGKSSNDTYTEQMDHERYRILSRLLKYTCTNDFILTEERINTEIDLFIHNTIQDSNNPNTFMDYSRAIEETTYTRPEFDRLSALEHKERQRADIRRRMRNEVRKRIEVRRTPSSEEPDNLDKKVHGNVTPQRKEKDSPDSGSFKYAGVDKDSFHLLDRFLAAMDAAGDIDGEDADFV